MSLREVAEKGGPHRCRVEPHESDRKARYGKRVSFITGGQCCRRRQRLEPDRRFPLVNLLLAAYSQRCSHRVEQAPA